MKCASRLCNETPQRKDCSGLCPDKKVALELINLITYFACARAQFRGRAAGGFSRVTVMLTRGEEKGWTESGLACAGRLDLRAQVLCKRCTEEWPAACVNKNTVNQSQELNCSRRCMPLAVLQDCDSL